MIVVTGASRGLGRAIAQRLMANGHEVVGLARSEAEADYEILPCDVSDAAAVRSVARTLRARKVPLEGLVNTAGIASMNLALTMPPSMVDKIMATNLMGTIYCCQSFVPLMVRQKTGFVINFSTIAVAIGLQGESVYAASKAGVEGFSRAFAREVSSFDIRVNCIAPGPIQTDLIAAVSKPQIDEIINRQIIQKQFEPSDVCDLVQVLSDPKSRSLTGEVLNVGGV
jgi:3-oxoacyl-[acyl-carrier protein] reductase